MGGAIPQFLYMQALFKRDYSSKYYSSLPFALVMVLVELPYLLVSSSICVLISYWAAGFDTGNALDGFYFWISYTMFVFYCHSLGVVTAYVFIFSLLLFHNKDHCNFSLQMFVFEILAHKNWELYLFNVFK